MMKSLGATHHWDTGQNFRNSALHPLSMVAKMGVCFCNTFNFFLLIILGILSLVAFFFLDST